MRRAVTTMLFTLLLNCLCFAQTAASLSSRQVVERYCKLDFEGETLSDEGYKELAGLFYSVREHAMVNQIAVVEGYEIRGADTAPNDAHYTVSYKQWGQIDASGRFWRYEQRASGAPMLVREYISVQRTEYLQFQRGTWNRVNGPPEWRISTGFTTPHVSVAAAIAYLTEIAKSTRDSVRKANAEKDVAALTHLHDLAKSSQARVMPLTVAGEFCKLNNDGKLIPPEGRKRLSDFAAHPEFQRPGVITVVREGCVPVMSAILEESKADVLVDCLVIGEIDRNTARFTALPDAHSPGMRLKWDVNFLLTSGPAGQKKWTIEDKLETPDLNIKAAIRVVAELRNASSDKSVVRNANRTIATLRYLASH